MVALPRVAAALVLLLLMAPAVEAHLAESRPILQRSQFPRIVDLRPADPGIELLLEIENDPLRHVVIHGIEPSRGIFYAEYRKDASIGADRFFVLWQFERLVEFRDVNLNARFEPASDTVVRSWRFENYDWRREAIQTVQLADVQGTSAIWAGNLTGAPSMRMQVAFAGKDFTDEGAFVRAQDVILYYDVTNIPERGVGSLYALEFALTVQEDSALSLFRVEGTPTALLADTFLRRGFLVWGGEGFFDGREQRVNATIEDEGVVDGNRTAKLFIHMPTVDRSMRFVMVTGIEYASEAARSPSPTPSWLAVAGCAFAALAARRRRA